ncbi:MAG TPA: hypothetical protein VMY35_16585 [Phycisphaerae bacterium]|nr:hypothetical protein [Phycisphaerae bacterium]
MAAGWKRVLLEGDAAELSDDAPPATDGTAAAAGVGPEASRDDHVHALGPLVADLDFASASAVSFVLENQTTANAPDPAAETIGQEYFDTTLDRPRVWVATA